MTISKMSSLYSVEISVHTVNKTYKEASHFKEEKRAYQAQTHGFQFTNLSLKLCDPPNLPISIF